MDLDKQGNTTKFFNRFAYGRKTMGDVLTLNATMQDVIMQTDFEHVDLAPSNMKMLLFQLSATFSASISLIHSPSTHFLTSCASALYWLLVLMFRQTLCTGKCRALASLTFTL